MRSALSQSGLAKHSFHEPLGWFIFKIVDSPHTSATLAEIRAHWTFGDIVDAYRRVRFREILDDIRAEENNPKG